MTNLETSSQPVDSNTRRSQARPAKAQDSKQSEVTSASAKSALVVDDSKLARYVLKEMLVKHGISVTTASSAEEALGLLCTLKPDVIFMDHMMPGMDGFQALHAIKNDPKTAMIPIMMYTSRDQSCDKDLYFGQARALGAVGVLPKKLKPVELENVLAQLKLLPEQNEVTSGTPSTPNVAKASVANEKTQVSAVEKTGEEDIEFDQDAVRIINDSKYSLEELAKSAEEEYEKDSMRSLFRQLFNEQKEGITSSQREAMDSLVAQTSPWFFSSHKRFLRWQKVTFISVVAIILLISSIFYSDNQQEKQAVIALQKQLLDQQQLIQGLSEQLTELQKSNALKRDGLSDSNGAGLSSSATLDSDYLFEPTSSGLENSASSSEALEQYQPYKKVFDAIRLPYGVSFDDERLQAGLESVLQQLDKDNFIGALKVTLHTGRFCEVQGVDGLMVKADDESYLSDCQISSLSAMEYANRVSLDFDAFIPSLRQRFPNQGVEFEDAGRNSVLVPYPEFERDLVAKDWNSVALVNNRIEFSLMSQ